MVPEAYEPRSVDDAEDERAAARAYNGEALAEELYAVCWHAAWGRGALAKRSLALWCAMREVQARQLAAGSGSLPRATPGCSIAELTGLTNQTERQVRRGIAQLEGAGLVLWSRKRVLFFGLNAIPEAVREQVQAEILSTKRAGDQIPLDRALLRDLARGTTHSLFCTALITAYRCAFFDPLNPGCIKLRGSVKASWVGHHFGLARSTWRAGLAELERRGRVLREQYRAREYRWEAGQIIDLFGYGRRPPAVEAECEKSGGPGADAAGNSGGAKENKKHLFSEKTLRRDVLKDQPPTALVFDQQQAEEEIRSERAGGSSPSTLATPPCATESAAACDSTTAKHEELRQEDLRNPDVLRAEHQRAAALGLVASGEAGLLEVQAQAERALQSPGIRNPVALFRASIHRRWGSRIRAEHEEAARRRMAAVSAGDGAGPAALADLLHAARPGSGGELGRICARSELATALTAEIVRQCGHWGRELKNELYRRIWALLVGHAVVGGRLRVSDVREAVTELRSQVARC